MHENEKIIIPSKYKFLFLHIYNSNTSEEKAYDVRIFPTSIPSTISVRIYGINNFVSGIVNLEYQSYNRTLNIVKSETALEVFGIY